MIPGFLVVCDCFLVADGLYALNSLLYCEGTCDIKPLLSACGTFICVMEAAHGML